MVDDNNAWALAGDDVDRLVLHWDGRHWSATGAEIPADVTALAPSPNGEMVVARWSRVDNGEPRASLWLGGTEARVRLTTADQRIEKIWRRSAEEIWALGQAGTVIRCLRTVCTLLPSPDDDHLIAAGERDGKVWVGSEHGALYEWTITGWVSRVLRGDLAFRTMWTTTDGRLLGESFQDPRLRRLGEYGWVEEDLFRQHVVYNLTIIEDPSGAWGFGLCPQSPVEPHRPCGWHWAKGVWTETSAVPEPIQLPLPRPALASGAWLIHRTGHAMWWDGQKTETYGPELPPELILPVVVDHVMWGVIPGTAWPTAIRLDPSPSPKAIPTTLVPLH
jgi:hypothetical protein